MEFSPLVRSISAVAEAVAALVGCKRFNQAADAFPQAVRRSPFELARQRLRVLLRTHFGGQST